MMEKKQFWDSLKSGEFASMVKESSKGERLLASKDVYHVMKPVFAETDDTERMYCIFLNCRNRVIAIEKMFEGTITQMAVYPRELPKSIINLRATAIILVHNHPSGDPSPSREDSHFKYGVRTNLDVGIITWRFHLPVIIAGSLELSHESILRCSLPYLVMGVRLSVGNVELISAFKTYE